MDFATRAWNHSFPFDPIIRSLLDTDFYKLLMQQFIWERYPNVEVCWRVSNRTRSVRLADEIDLDELREQLEHVRTLRFTPTEIIYLRGQSFYGQTGIFRPAYLEALRTFELPEYQLGETRDGQLDLSFDGPWWKSTMWEIHALAIINELRSRSIMRRMSRSQLDILYARAKVKLYAKLEKLRALADLNLSDFGTRRRHGFLWQEHCVMTAKELLRDGFSGTSNVFIAMKHGLEAKGTNAHELPMVFAALARLEAPGNATALKQSQYKVLQQWQNEYRGNLLVFLPDTYGTTQFLRNAPQWVSNWTGARPDSKNPIAAGEELLCFWRRMALTPSEVGDKLLIFADGLDVRTNASEPNGADISDIHRHFAGQVQLGFGWGTNFTNDFIDCHPTEPDAMMTLSLVCKVHSVNGQPAVKLSDNWQKASGPPDEISAYERVFGADGLRDVVVTV